MKDKITITKGELAIAMQTASNKVTEKMKKKTDKPEIQLVSNLFGVMFTAELLKDLFDEAGQDS